MEKFIKKDSNYKIPPIGPLIFADLERDQAILFLFFTIDRIQELELSDKPLSYMEYEDLSMFLYYCNNTIIKEKDTRVHYFYDNIIHKACKKIDKLYENRQIYADVPAESLTIVVDNKLHLEINSKRSMARLCIRDILDYLNNNNVSSSVENNISEKILNQIKEYVTKVLELEIFDKELITFFPDKVMDIFFNIKINYISD
jgi:hypothetical protein